MKFNELFKDEIIRRYFVMNSFDGVLTVLGILIALMIGGVTDVEVIVLSCLGSGVAMGVSGFWGAYLTERAERKFDVLEKGLKHTSKVVKQNLRISLRVALVDSLSPFLPMIILIIPFFLLPISYSYFTSFALAVVLVSLLGAFIAKIGQQNIIKSILRMLSATLAITIILYFFASIGLV